MNKMILENLLDAVRKAFSIQASTQVQITGVRPGKAETRPRSDIAAIIGISGTKMSGSLALCLPTQTFLSIVNRMLGENYAQITQENSDAAGEMLNIIYGLARTQINQNGYDFAPAIPTVVRGDNLSLSSPTHGGGLIAEIRCETDLGPFHLELNLKELTSKDTVAGVK